MERKSERRTIIGVSIWHFVNALLTIFIFGIWFKNNGDIAMVEMYPELAGGSSSYVDILYTVMTTYGVAIILVGIINLYCLKYIEDNKINRKWQCWMVFMAIASLLSMDVLSTLLYMITLVTYSAKNKAIRVKLDSYSQASI
jgi:hypothetical protein